LSLRLVVAFGTILNFEESSVRTTAVIVKVDAPSELVVASLTPVELLAPPNAYLRRRGEVIVALPPFQLAKVVPDAALTVKLTLTGTAAS
jgi:hypothetical protein